VLNPLKLNSIEREQLAALFDRSCAVSSDEDEEAIHQAINEIVEVGP